MKKTACCTKTNFPAKIAILIAGILLGFLIGQLSFRQEIKTETPKTASVGTGIQQSAENQPQPVTPAITPKILDKITGVSPDDDDVMGEPNAPVTIVEFTDYQCKFCKTYFDENFERILKDYVETGKVKYVVRDFPLEEHPQALLAAGAAECAGDQGKYREMHDRLFNGQDEWSYQTTALATFKTYADSLALNRANFDSCLDSGKYDTEISKDIADGEIYTVKSTPTVFINDKKIVGAQSYELFKKAIEAELAK